MAEERQPSPIQDEEEITPGYKPPEKKTLQEIVAADQEDESLKKYKEQLLGGALGANQVVVDASNPSRVIVKSLSLIVDGRPDTVIDLSGDLEEVKKLVFPIKEGIQYRMRVHFYVQREIVTGLRYVQKISRKGIKVAKTNNMVGSYGPKTELQSYTSPVEDMPSGFLSRGTYNVKSLFTDDDNNEHLKWEWSFELKKDW